MSEYYSLEEAARRLGKSEDQIREMVTNGELRAFRDAGSFKFRKADIDALAPGPPPEESKEEGKEEAFAVQAEAKPEGEQEQQDELLFLIDEEGTTSDPDDLTLIGESDEAAVLGTEEEGGEVFSEEIALAEEGKGVDDGALTAVMEEQPKEEAVTAEREPAVDLFAEAQEEMAAGEGEAEGIAALPLGRAARVRQAQEAALYRSPLMSVLLVVAFLALLFTGAVIYTSFMTGPKPLLKWLGGA